ncbi:hypothetical protein TNCV_4945571 [Trichonephila clavipes]|nr:hypothetical protein TNCV_4945571 [Trichonephila clavipes]
MKKHKGLKFRQQRSEATNRPRPIHAQGYVERRWFLTEFEKCAGALSCMNHAFWGGRYSLQELRKKCEICLHADFFNPTMVLEILRISLFHSPRLAHHSFERATIIPIFTT